MLPLRWVQVLKDKKLDKLDDIAKLFDSPESAASAYVCAVVCCRRQRRRVVCCQICGGAGCEAALQAAVSRHLPLLRCRRMSVVAVAHISVIAV